MTGQDKKGLPLKILLPPGLIIFSLLIAFLARHFIQKELEYQKDQARLSLVMKTKLPAESLVEVKYPIKGYRIPGIGGFCWLESSSGLIKYLEPDIDFDTFVFYGRPSLIMAGRSVEERWGPALNQIHAFVELGYTPFLAFTQASVPLPTQKLFPDIKRENIIYFKTPREELNFIKKLISAKIIPIINYQGDFSAVVGYNQKGVWLVKSDPDQTDKEGRNFMTCPVAFEPTFVSYQELFDGWKIYHYLLWFLKTSPRRPQDEIYLENKKDAQSAGQNMQAVIDFLKKGGNLSKDLTFEFDIPSSISLYRYFKKRGNLALANKYLEIAKIYDARRSSLGFNEKIDRKFIIETFTQVQPLLEEAGKMWP